MDTQTTAPDVRGRAALRDTDEARALLAQYDASVRAQRDELVEALEGLLAAATQEAYEPGIELARSFARMVLAKHDRRLRRERGAG